MAARSAPRPFCYAKPTVGLRHMQYIAIEKGMVSVVTVIVKSSVLFTVILAGIFLHEKLTKKGWFGILLILNGLVIAVV